MIVVYEVVVYQVWVVRLILLSRTDQGGVLFTCIELICWYSNISQFIIQKNLIRKNNFSDAQ